MQKVVGNSLKSLEVSEEKANQRVEEFKREMKTLTVRLKEAENRAESAEKQVKRLQKEVDRLEGTFILLSLRLKYLAVSYDLTAECILCFVINIELDVREIKTHICTHLSPMLSFRLVFFTHF